MTGPATASPPTSRRAARAAAAASPAAAPPPPGQASLPATPVPWSAGTRRLLRVPVPVLLWTEVLLATLLVALVRRDALLVVVGVLVLGTLVLGAGRRRGAPLYRLVGTWWRFRARARTAAREVRAASPTADSTAGPAGPLAALLPRLHVTSAPLRAERRFGVCFDGTGWVAVLEVEPPPQVTVPHTWPAAVPLGLLAGLLAVDDIRLSCAQVLVRTVPAPVLVAGPDPAAASSYRRIRPVGVAALRQTWIALRLDAGPAQDAIAARGGGVTGAHRSLKRVAGRALELLEAAGLRARALEEPAVRDVLATTLLGPGAPGGPSGTAVDGAAGETWSWWQCSGRAHLTWWVAGWPATHDPVEPAVQLLQAVQPAFGVVSLAVHATDDPDDGPVARVLLRAVVPVEGAGTLVQALEGSAATVGLGLRRLDGDHGPGTCATLPLGGGRR